MQTGYLGIQTLQYNLPYDGGFCEWYYANIQDVNNWQSINPDTQELIAAPTLFNGINWNGPIKTPNNSLSYKESLKNSNAGIFYEQILDANQIGSNRTNRVYLENLAHYQFVIVGKVRAGGYYVVIGNKNAGMKLVTVEDIGAGQFKTNKTDLIFTLKSQHKALVIPSFQGNNSDAVNGSTYTNITNGNDYEKINFTTTNQDPVFTFQWTNTRKIRFGQFPLIEVWSTATGTPTKDTSPNITCDSSTAPTIFSINRTGDDTGFIIIK